MSPINDNHPQNTGVPVYDTMTPEQKSFTDTTFDEGIRIGYDLAIAAVENALNAAGKDGSPNCTDCVVLAQGQRDELIREFHRQLKEACDALPPVKQEEGDT